MSEWREATLDQLGRIVTGKTPPTADSGNYGGTTPFVTPTDLDGRRIIANTSRYLTAQGVDTVKSAFIPARAVMVSCIGSDMGKAAIAGEDCVTNQQINSVIVEGGNDPLYVYYNLSRRKEEIRGSASGSAQPILNKSAFGRLRISLPPLEIQQAASSILGALDDKIDLNRRMNEALEAMARAIFKDWFVDFGPTRAKMKGREPYLSPDVWSLFPDRLDGDAKPAGWESEDVGSLFKVVIGRTPPRHQHQHFVQGGSGCTWLSIKGMGGLQAFAFKSDEDLTNEAVRQFRIPCVPSGTVMVSFKLTVGRVAIAAADMYTNEAIASLIRLPATTLGAEYTYCFLKEYDYGKLGSTSSIATAVNSDSIRSIEMLVPDAGCHDAFSTTVAPLFYRIRCNCLESDALERTRDLLLPKLMSGEIRIKDAEKALEDVL